MSRAKYHVLSFSQFLVEFDAKYFLKLPTIEPPDEVARIADRFNRTIKWKRAARTSLSIVSLNLIAINARDVDNLRVWFHELGHLIYHQHDAFRRLAQYVIDRFSTREGRFKFALGHIYSHSGSTHELEEVWANLCALYWTDYEFPEDPTIRQALEMVIKP
jgi:hypothetical protein